MNFNYFICNSIDPKDLKNIKFECDYIANLVQIKKKFESDLVHCIYRNESEKNISSVYYIDLKGESLYMGMVENGSEKRINNTKNKDAHIGLVSLSDEDIKNISKVINISKNNLDQVDINMFNNLFIIALNKKFINNEFIIDYSLLDSSIIKRESIKHDLKRILDKYFI